MNEEYPSTLSRYFMGVDLGQVSDYTAICILQHMWGRHEMVNTVIPTAGVVAMGASAQASAVQTIRTATTVYLPKSEQVYNIVHLERVRLGTSYPDVVELVGQRFAGIPEGADKTLLVDGTGVGKAVVDLMRERGLRPISIVITGGDNVTAAGHNKHVPKRDLIGALQVLMQSGQLKVARGLRDGLTLERELRNYKYTLSQSAHDTYNAREGEHDDLVLAACLSAWGAQRKREVRVL